METVPTVSTPPTPEPYQPTEAQLGRAAALKRFNRLTVYLPVTFFALIVLILFVLMLINALPNETSFSTRQLLSGLADIILIVSIIPIWLVLTIIPVGAIAVWVQMRQKDVSPLRGLQILLWRVDSKVGQLKAKTDEVAPKVAAPVVTAHARITFVSAWLNALKRLFWPSSGK